MNGTLRILAVAALACLFAAEIDAADDAMERRMRVCTQCHDDTGMRVRNSYYPRIAGKPEGYLFNQLVNFRDGRRFNALMTHLVEHLPDAYLREMAAYFAARNPVHAAPQSLDLAPETLQRGRTLALHGDASGNIPACASCHGNLLMGAMPAIPGLIGLPRDYLIAQFGSWRIGTRHALAPDCMAEITARMSPQDIAAVSAWLSTQAVPAGATPESASRAELPMACGSVPAPLPSAGR